MNDVDIAKKLYDEAAAAYVGASAAYEAAMMSTGAPRDSEVAAQYRRAGDESAWAMQALVRARKAQAPSFEALLTDPAVQVDPNGEILESILSYTEAPPASAGMPIAGSDIYELPSRPARAVSSSKRPGRGAPGYATAGRQTAAC